LRPCLLASGLIHLAILVISGGSWRPVSLRKAATFGLSFGLTLITIVWVSSFLRLGVARGPCCSARSRVACVLETVLVSLPGVARVAVSFQRRERCSMRGESRGAWPAAGGSAHRHSSRP